MEVPAGGRVVTPEDVLPPDEAAALKLVASASVEELVFAPPDSSHVKLPTGLLWEGELLRDVEVRELTGRDEELLARENKASAGFNALRFVDRILANTVVSVGGRAVEGSMLQNMLVGDRVYLSLAVRRLTYGAEWEVPDFLCRLCGKSNALAFDLNCPGTDIRLRELPDPTNQVVTVHIKRGPAAVRLVNGADELAAGGDGRATWPEQVRRCRPGQGQRSHRCRALQENEKPGSSTTAPRRRIPARTERRAPPSHEVPRGCRSSDRAAQRR